ncbi:MAG: DUF11 domain-containing protein [Chloroflexi bacterium]|uniref:choice-of-anchor Q domain-containing protein n=1 Tax=Candidatus Flexifilum breve TaxID=3140694 RepID=UPI00313469D6|nr:DUF11 domain-containing protein [Chloroflexota bacterium]
MRKFFFFLSLATLLGIIPRVQAATFTVSTAAELIAAITAANSNNQDDTITLSANIALTSATDFTDGVNGLPSILADGGNSLTIEGAGFTITRSGAATFRLMHIASGAEVYINHLTMTNGLATGGGLGTLGGAIYTAGALTIADSTFSNNVATSTSGLGAAIFVNRANLNVARSVFSANQAAMGAAIYSYLNSSTITASLFTNNQSQSGGGALVSESANLNLSNSTVSGNSAPSSYGGALYQLGATAILTNNTITNNSAGAGAGGVYNLAATVTLRNNIIAGNTAPANAECYNDSIIGGTLTVGNAYNVFGVNGSAGGCPNGATDIVPAGAIGTILAPLADNNGPTFTHALVPGSPALDAANFSNCPITDQRGYLRGFDATGTPNSPQVGDCDSGAFEYSLDPVYDSAPPVNATINLGSVVVGSEISTTLQIIEDGDSALTVSLSSIGGLHPGDFRLIGLPTTIGNGNPPQDTAIICTPSAAGVRSAQLTFTTNDPTQPTVTYAVECTGIDTVVASASLPDINQIVTEDATGISVNVQLDVPAGFSSPDPITVEIVDAASGNATSGSDYAAFAPTTVTFAGPLTAGTTYIQTVTVNLLEDSLIEGAEYLALRINAVTGSAEIAPADSHTIILNDDDVDVFAQASFAVNSAIVDEAAGTLTVDVQVLIPAGFNLAGDITLTIDDAASGNATSGADYGAFAAQTLTFVDAPFVAGTTYQQTITVPILDDTALEGVETFDLAITGISGPVELITPTTFTGIINDDEIVTLINEVLIPGATVSGGGDTDYITKTVDHPFATIGQTVTYTIRARNPKTIPLTQVVIYDVFDERLADLRVLSTTHGRWVFNANTLTVSDFTLQPGEEAVIVVSARVASLRAGETIPNAAILESPNASVHVSNLALVGETPAGSSGGAAHILVTAGQLPATGEPPLWRSLGLWGLGSVIVASGVWWARQRRANHRDAEPL